MLGLSDHLDWNPIQEFVISTQDPITGGKFTCTNEKTYEGPSLKVDEI
jgi:hypothetical protein